MDNSFLFSGDFILEDDTLIKTRGEFDTLEKSSIATPESVFLLTNIIFQNKSFLKCKVSSQDERFKRVDSLDFIFDKENNCYLAEVLSKKQFLPVESVSIRRDQFIEKDSQVQESIGILILRIISKNLLKYASSKERLKYLLEARSTRE